MAVKYGKYYTEEFIHHSNRGLQYCSNEFHDILFKNDFKYGMTESYDPYAAAERVYGILKQVFIGDNKNLELPIMKALVIDSIKIYNHKRPHNTSYMITPETMHQQRHITYKNKNPVNKCQLDSIN